MKEDHQTDKEKDMDKQFWLSIRENNYAIPAGHSVLPLTEELFSYLGLTDQVLRTIAEQAFYHWIEQDLYSLQDVRGLIPRLLANLQTGLGKTEDDTVFLRSYSLLWLAATIEHYNEKPALKKEEIATVLEAILAHFAAERDFRCLVPIKGCADTIAHSADLLGVLAISSHTNANDHARILDCIARKLKAATDWIYLYGEDDRFARPVIRIFERDTLSMDQIKDWLASLSADWDGAWQNEEGARAYFAGRNFLRAIRIFLLEGDQVPKKAAILEILRSTLDQAKPWRNCFFY
jgi:Protein of unknown function (DUF2785)